MLRSRAQYTLLLPQITSGNVASLVLSSLNPRLPVRFYTPCQRSHGVKLFSGGRGVQAHRAIQIGCLDSSSVKTGERIGTDFN